MNANGRSRRFADGGPVHPRVSLSQLSSWGWTLDDDLAFCRRAGITNVGACVVKLEAAGWMSGAHRLADAGLRVTNLVGVAPLLPAGHEAREAQRAHAWRALESARVIGAECLVVTSGPDPSGTWKEAAERYKTTVEPVLTEASRRDVPIAIEHANRRAGDACFPQTLHDAVQLARTLGVGVCVDVSACWAEPGLAETIRAGVDTFRVVRVSDAAPLTRPGPRRLLPGDGDLPLEQLLGALLDAGYAGVFDIEFARPRSDGPDHDGDCRRAVDHVGAILESLGA
jgi:sugar phosphate isomerase/epimerase